MQPAPRFRRTLRPLAVATAALVALGTVGGCSRASEPSRSVGAGAPGDSALAALDGLTVKGRSAMTGYTRAQFGAAWTDDNDDPLGHNGCDTRNDILGRDLTATLTRPGTGGCVIRSGRLEDPYTATVITFVRGASTSSDIQIDHVVPLGNAWATGAQGWSARKRIDLANDPLNLLAVSGPVNQAKGDGDAATWLPPSKAYRCAYVARQVAVKAHYGLWTTAAEHSAMARVLSTCPAQRLPGEAR